MKEFVGKNILLIVENNGVPLDVRVWREAKALKDEGASVCVICPVVREYKEHFIVIDGINVFRYEPHFSNGTILGYVKEYLNAFIKASYLLHKVLFKFFPIHVVHVSNPPDIYWPFALYLKLFKVKYIFDEHDLCPEAFLSRYEHISKNSFIFKMLKLFQRLSYKVSNAIISTNESYKAKAISVNAKYAVKTFIVRNGPDTRYFKPVAPNPMWKRDRSFLLAFIGIMAIQDGLEYIIRAIDVLVNKKSVKNFIVILVGVGDDYERLRRLTREYDLEDYISFTGFIPFNQALEILSTADICLSPDPYNELNNLSTMNKVMEYMALGKPIVSFDLKEARYSAGEGALYVENNNAEAFADGILKLMQNNYLANQIGEKGRIRLEELFCWQKQIPNLYNVYLYLVK